MRRHDVDADTVEVRTELKRANIYEMDLEAGRLLVPGHTPSLTLLDVSAGAPPVTLRSPLDRPERLVVRRDAALVTDAGDATVRWALDRLTDPPQEAAGAAVDWDERGRVALYQEPNSLLVRDELTGEVLFGHAPSPWLSRISACTLASLSLRSAATTGQHRTEACGPAATTS